MAKPKGESPLFQPWVIDPRSYGIVEVAAIQALAAGTATAQQQQDALRFILLCVCRVDDEPFCPGEEGRRSTDYALGMRRVGTFIRSLIHADKARFKRDARPSEQPT